jgi:hypothetical protein
LNAGDGTYVLSPELYDGANNYGIATGDLNDDGYIDVFVGSGRSYVLVNDGDGTFTKSEEDYILCQGRHCSVGRRPHVYGPAIGDLDGDDNLDVFLGNIQYQYNQVLLNDGDGTFAFSGEEYGSTEDFCVELGDLDGDGDLDAFVLSQYSQNSIWFNDGDATFTLSEQSIGASYISREVALGDLDADGDLDAFIVNEANAPNEVWLNDGTGHYSIINEEYGRDRSHGVALGDVDGDGDLDAFVANLATNDKVWLNDGDGTFTEFPQDFWHANSQDIALGDLDNDGDLDAVLVTNHAHTGIWINQPNCFMYQWDTGAGNQTTSTAIDLQPGTYMVTVTDGNGCDQIASVILIDPSTNPEICDGIDNDCDGLIDDEDPSVIGQPTWHEDSDGDGFGNPQVVLRACYQPPGFVATGTDCDDENPLVFPGAEEVLDGVDNDCDGEIDEGLTSMSIDIGECTTVLLGYEPMECTEINVQISDGTPPYSYAWSTGEVGETITVCPAETATYGVTVTDALNQTAADELTVQVIDVRCGNDNNPKVLVCHYPPGNPDNPQTICISVSALETHLVEHGDHVGVCDALNPCGEELEGFVTGLEQDHSSVGYNHTRYTTENNLGGASDTEVLLYPNPANTQVTVYSSSIMHKIRLYTITGKELGVYSPQDLVQVIPLTKYSTGTYILRTEDQAGQLHTKRFVILK